MAEIFELVSSRAFSAGQSPTGRNMYLVGRTEDEVEVYATLAASVPATFGSLTLKGVSAEPIGGGLWRCVADYSATSKADSGNPAGQSGGEGGGGSQTGEGDPLGPEISVDITAVTQHITQSLRTVDSAKRTADTRAITNHKGAIGVSKEGVAGCDIPLPSMTWSETWEFADVYVTWGYLKRLRDLVGRVANHTFRTFAAGEVMFMGAQTPPAQQGKRKITFHFRSEPNITNFRLTPDFDTVDKRGFDYLWVEYEPSTQAGAILMVPRAVFVEEVGAADGTATPTNERDFRPMWIGS